MMGAVETIAWICFGLAVALTIVGGLRRQQRSGQVAIALAVVFIVLAIVLK